jgi:hypothetical protein
VLGVLSEREKRALEETEALLLRQDEDLVRAFIALARYDPPAPRTPVTPTARVRSPSRPGSRCAISCCGRSSR